MNIKNKVVIVTGASFGIGEATAKLLSQNGAKVVLAARSKEKIDKLSKQLPYSLAIETDVTKEKQIKEMVKKTIEYYGKVDILINNAGRGYDASILEIDPEKFRQLFELNVIAPLVAMQSVIPLMQKQGFGAIINVSSGTALMNIPGMAAYSSLKKALVGISLTAREEFKDQDIIISVIYPYITKTDFQKNTIGASSDLNEDEDYPAKFDQPKHVAQKILELIKSEKAEGFAHDWMEKQNR